jgi:hypothetical protein
MWLQDSKHTAVSIYLFLLDYTLWHLCTGSLNCYRPLVSVHLELGVGAELTETLVLLVLRDLLASPIPAHKLALVNFWDSFLGRGMHEYAQTFDKPPTFSRQGECHWLFETDSVEVYLDDDNLSISFHLT